MAYICLSIQLCELMKKLGIKFIIDARRRDAFGRTQIFCKVRLDREDVNTYPTSQVCFPQDWDAVKQRVNTRGLEAEAANMAIAGFEVRIRQAYATCVMQGNLNTESLRANIKASDDRSPGSSALLTYVREYIVLLKSNQNTAIGLHHNTVRIYEAMEGWLVEFVQADGKSIDAFNNGQAFSKAFYEYILRSGKQPMTARAYLQKLVVVGEFLAERGVVKSAPFKSPKVKLAHVSTAPKEFEFTYDSWVALQSYKPRNRNEHMVVLMAVLQGYTGLAISDLLRLMWSDIHDAEPMRVIIQHRKKNFRGDQRVGKTAVIPVLSQAEKALAELKSLQIPQFVVCPRITPETYNRRLGRIAALMRIPQFTSHDLRKVFANYVCKRAGVSGHALSSSLGHSSTGTTERYYLKDDVAQMLGEFVVVQNYLNQQEAVG